MSGQAAMSSAREIAAKLRGGVSDGPPPEKSWRGGFSDVKSNKARAMRAAIGATATAVKNGWHGGVHPFDA